MSGAALLGFGDDENGNPKVKASVEVGLGMKGKRVKVNPYFLFFDCAATFVAAFCFFTIGTSARALSFGSDWIGACAIGSATAACYMFVSMITGGTTMPHFDIFTILLSLRAMGITSLRKLPDGVPVPYYAPSVRRSKPRRGAKAARQASYTLEFMHAFWLCVAVIAAGFASAGVCRLVLDSAYDNAEITIRDSDFNAGEAFFYEMFFSFFLNILAVILPLHGVHPINIALLLGLVTIGFQAVGFNVSSASFNFVRWLSVNSVGGSSAWNSDAWVWPIGVLVSTVAIYIVHWIMSYALYYGNKYAEKKMNTQ